MPKKPPNTTKDDKHSKKPISDQLRYYYRHRAERLAYRKEYDKKKRSKNTTNGKSSREDVEKQTVSAEIYDASRELEHGVKLREDVRLECPPHLRETHAYTQKAKTLDYIDFLSVIGIPLQRWLGKTTSAVSPSITAGKLIDRPHK